ncbi:putative solute carrier family 35 member F6 [Skeletonema marinoi]|uniref:Solute carrier family 35 member F6 n=1 Tax=Skeletonema marinoi TaxID=267567 RepID=A0AAD8XXL5_9STRA|nr:putative solute carrier family 35 member F6 [Skeletonema marinoi]
MYSAKVSFILGAMVLTGAARSVTAKIFYQLGFNHPLFLTLLYLIGQALSLIPYNIMVLLKKRGYRLVWDDHAILPGLSNRIEEEESVSIPSRHTVRTRQTLRYTTPDDEMERAESMASLDENKANNHDVESQRRKSTVSVRFASEECTNTSSAARASISFADGTKESDGAGAVMEDHLEAQGKSSTSLDPGSTSEKMAKKPSLLDRAKSARMSSKTLDTARRISASTHGLPTHSRTRSCHANIPWYLKPAVPAFFNLLNSAMRWASLVHVAASVAEMLISGMELVLSVCATRLVRGRKITWVRWVGVLVVTLGIVLVGVFDTNNVAGGETNDESTVNKQIIGILLILGQSVMSVIQDLTEEVFMQETAFPPPLLVGMEGAYGIVIALILYFPIAPLLGENPSDVASSLSEGNVIGLAIGWTLLVTVTGIFNIAATAVTSSMTRNVWKNMRTLLVWIMGLILFYATGSSELGEGWYIPGSFFILLSYGVMCVGIFIYYGKGARAT